MAVTSDGELWTFGAGSSSAYPVLGYEDVSKTTTARRIEVLREQFVVDVSAGWNHCLCLTADGKVCARMTKMKIRKFVFFFDDAYLSSFSCRSMRGATTDMDK